MTADVHALQATVERLTEAAEDVARWCDGMADSWPDDKGRQNAYRISAGQIREKTRAALAPSGEAEPPSAAEERPADPWGLPPHWEWHIGTEAMGCAGQWWAFRVGEPPFNTWEASRERDAAERAVRRRNTECPVAPEAEPPPEEPPCECYARARREWSYRRSMGIAPDEPSPPAGFHFADCPQHAFAPKAEPPDVPEPTPTSFRAWASWQRLAGTGHDTDSESAFAAGAASCEAALASLRGELEETRRGLDEARQRANGFQFQLGIAEKTRDAERAARKEAERGWKADHDHLCRRLARAERRAEEAEERLAGTLEREDQWSTWARGVARANHPDDHLRDAIVRSLAEAGVVPGPLSLERQRDDAREEAAKRWRLMEAAVRERNAANAEVVRLREALPPLLARIESACDDGDVMTIFESVRLAHDALAAPTQTTDPSETTP